MVSELTKMVSTPSVSRQPDGAKRLADLLKTRLGAVGYQVDDIATEGPPLLLARGGNRNAKTTVLFYAHYDAQNVEPERWTHCKPFEPVLFDGDPADGANSVELSSGADIGDDWRLCGRGAADDKGPIVVLLEVLEGIRSQKLGPTAVGVKILLDGEEESGSPHLGDALQRPELKDALAADVVISLDGPVFPNGAPTVSFGVRGILTLDLTLFGATSDLHSGHYGNWAPNPAQELSWLLSQLKDPFSGKVAIDGYYDCRTPLSKTEQEALDAVPDIGPEIREEYAIPRTEEQWLLKEAITHPSFNVRGLAAGNIGKGARTAIPSRAEAAIDIRLVKGCTGDHMTGLVREKLENLGYHVVAEDPDPVLRAKHARIAKLVRRGGGYDAVRTPMDWEVSRAIGRAVERGGAARPVLLPNMGGSLPFHLFEQHLGQRLVGVPLVNHDDNQHGPNETIRLGNLWRGFDVLAAILLTYGEA
jgi:acetylornithine deacetylase/succinyl-diaminopimelate desuccinylase-like protein